VAAVLLPGFAMPVKRRRTAATNGPPQGAPLDLVAYALHKAPSTRIAPAPRTRDWMDDTLSRFAYRCLPLLIANQAGWLVLNPHRFRATWDGSAEISGVRIEPLGGLFPGACSHFGSGIVTWNLPYLFRTPQGYNLLVRGPANLPKDGASALEGIVETDWSPATFTVNWKLTRRGLPVEFGEDEPICMLVPQRRGELESFRPRISSLARSPDLARSHARWSFGRSRFIRELQEAGSRAQQRGWQRDYMLGVLPDGERAPQHQRNLNLTPFVSEPEDD
jgi:Family of unknown function (DUF6065)